MKDNIIIFGFIGILFFFLITSILLPDQDISLSERRHLATFPNVIENGTINSSFFEEFGEYVTDQFPGRDWFRSLQALAQFSIFGHLENDSVFVKNGMIFETDSLREDAVSTFVNKIEDISKKYFDETNFIYYSVIPNKIHYLEDSIYPRIDYHNLISSLQKSLLASFTWVDIEEELDLSSYYATDIHWRQEKIEGVVRNLLNAMETNYVSMDYQTKTFSSFAGSLYNKIALPVQKENLNYYHNSFLDSILVYNYEKKEMEPVYQDSYFSHVDPYDVFLGGASALLTIENKEQENGKNLIIFRDSFASSLTPLLISSYHKITLIDLRYIASDYLSGVVDFSNSDILFLYSDEVINNSYLLK